MSTRWTLSMLCVLGASCSVRNGMGDSGADAGSELAEVRDAARVTRDAGSDAGDARGPLPWADGTLRVQEITVEWGYPRSSYGRCESAQLVAPAAWFGAYSAAFLRDQRLYYSVMGSPGFVNVETGEIRTLIEPSRVQMGYSGFPVRSQGRFTLAVQSFYERAQAIVRFDDLSVTQPGRVIWAHQEIPPTRRAYGTSIVSGTDSLLAFNRVAVDPAWSEQINLYVINPDGTGLRNLTYGRPDGVFEFRADGDRVILTLEGQIQLWTRGDTAPHKIAQTQRAQWLPWISGDHVVWTDQRHGVRGDRVDPDNPEIYYMNLRTQEVRRITHDPPERPVVQDKATVQGDWIVWVDLRHASAPNGGFLGDRMAIYGYHIPTAREYALVNDAGCRASHPVIFGEHVYFDGFVPSVNRSAMYRVPLPVVP